MLEGDDERKHWRAGGYREANNDGETCSIDKNSRQIDSPKRFWKHTRFTFRKWRMKFFLLMINYVSHKLSWKLVDITMNNGKILFICFFFLVKTSLKNNFEFNSICVTVKNTFIIVLLNVFDSKVDRSLIVTLSCISSTNLRRSHEPFQTYKINFNNH